MYFLKVILSGGCTKIPMLKKKLSDYFSSERILSNMAPDEVISLGAAKQVYSFCTYSFCTSSLLIIILLISDITNHYICVICII